MIWVEKTEDPLKKGKKHSALEWAEWSFGNNIAIEPLLCPLNSGRTPSGYSRSIGCALLLRTVCASVEQEPLCKWFVRVRETIGFTGTV